MIYEPRGKAREYSPLAVNVYRNCDHQCKYCYVRSFTPGFDAHVRPVSLEDLDKEAERASKQILMCFTTDPYCKANDELHNTRKALKILRQHRCSVAILSKGGTRCLQDMDIFRVWPDNRLKVGATLTFIDDQDSISTEPGAALPQDRFKALRILHENGIKTWVSLEPVVDPAQTLSIIEETESYVDHYKVGKLNHVANQIDWRKFGIEAVKSLREKGKQFYVKEDLRRYLDADFLTAEEADPDYLVLPDRPEKASVISYQSHLFA